MPLTDREALALLYGAVKVTIHARCEPALEEVMKIAAEQLWPGVRIVNGENDGWLRKPGPNPQ